MRVYYSYGPWSWGSSCGVIPLFRSRHLTTTVSTLCAQFLIRFYNDQFETLHALFSWSADMQVVFDYSSVKFLSLFSTFEQGFLRLKH